MSEDKVSVEVWLEPRTLALGEGSAGPKTMDIYVIVVPPAKGAADENGRPAKPLELPYRIWRVAKERTLYRWAYSGSQPGGIAPSAGAAATLEEIAAACIENYAARCQFEADEEKEP